MRTAFVNLPNREQIFRRYMCSYNSPTSLFPPSELMSLAAIVRDVKNNPAMIYDSVAEKANTEQTIAALKKFNPEIIVSLAGFEIFEQDLKEISALKKAFPRAHIILFGHYPTIFTKETFQNSKVDYILLNEADATFSELYDALAAKKNPSKIKGLAYRTSKSFKSTPVRERIKDIDSLPMPAHDLLNLNLYSETMVKKPFTVLHTTRGCPFPCNYCVHTYGREMHSRSAEKVLDEIEFVVKKLGVKGIRFFDDTFNVDKNRLKKICEGIKERDLNFEWTCFSRVNTLDEESLRLMREAGCIRMFIGIESGSQRMLDLYQKGYKKEEIKAKINFVKKAGIEATGFFMVSSEDTENDFQQSVQLAKECDLDYVLVTTLELYPGTALFNKLRDKVEFSLIPYVSKYKEPKVEERMIDMERRFYKAFYFRPSYAVKRIKLFLTSPIESTVNLIKLAAYTFGLSGGGDRRDYY